MLEKAKVNQDSIDWFQYEGRIERGKSSQFWILNIYDTVGKLKSCDIRFLFSLLYAFILFQSFPNFQKDESLEKWRVINNNKKFTFVSEEKLEKYLKKRKKRWDTIGTKMTQESYRS